MASSNGATKPVVKSANGTSKTEKEIQQAIAKKLPTDFTVQERISRLEHLQMLVQKYGAVKEKENELKTYLLEADGSQEYIIFCSGSDEKMKITNTNILRKLVQVVQNEMKEFREGVENEILSFSFDGE